MTVKLLPAVSAGPTIVCPVSNTIGALTATCSNVPVDAYTVQWSIGGNYYQGPTVNTVLAVYDPSLGFVTGSGSVIDNGIPAKFAISVKYLKNGTLTGGVTYIEHRASGDVTVSSTILSSMSLVGTTAIIYGQATVNGVAGYTLQLSVTDNGTPGINRDTFRVATERGNAGIHRSPLHQPPSRRVISRLTEVQAATPRSTPGACPLGIGRLFPRPSLESFDFH